MCDLINENPFLLGALVATIVWLALFTVSLIVSGQWDEFWRGHPDARRRNHALRSAMRAVISRPGAGIFDWVWISDTLLEIRYYIGGRMHCDRYRYTPATGDIVTIDTGSDLTRLTGSD